MAMPAEGVASLYRNAIEDVVLFLKKHHDNNYMIWNLSEHEYDVEKFDNQVRFCVSCLIKIALAHPCPFCCAAPRIFILMVQFASLPLIMLPFSGAEPRCAGFGCLPLFFLSEAPLWGHLPEAHPRTC
jgi:hypothetical protein